MLVYLVRHAHSLANAGQHDGLNSGLSPLGLRQVEALTRRLSGEQITAVYSSPFFRCLETAGPLARQLDVPVRLRPELCEYHGLPQETLRVTDLVAAEHLVGERPGVMACEDWRGPMVWPDVGETLEAMVSRTRSFVTFLKSRWPGEDDRVLVVGHGSPIARLIEAWLTDQPGPSFRFVIDNATLNLLRLRNGVSSLLQLNDTSHLQGVIAPESPFGQAADALSRKGSNW